WGINNDSQIVLYDDGPGAFAARAWWLLAWLGKREDVFVLDGGFRAWSAANLPLDTRPTAARTGNFSGSPDNSLIIEAQQLLAQLDTLAQPLLDARALPRFRGEVEPIDPVAGHIPGAICAPFTDNLAADGRFLSPVPLAERFDSQLNDRCGEPVA